jgi:hypothetical protein
VFGINFQKIDAGIVIPYYKILFFEATLQSLALQKQKNVKVYIGNDVRIRLKF